MGHIKGHAKRKVYCNIGLHQKRITIPYEQSKLTINETRKRTTNEDQVSRRRGIIKIRADIKKIEMNKTIEKINESKSWFF